MWSFVILVLVVSVILFAYQHKVYSYMSDVEKDVNDLEMTVDQLQKVSEIHDREISEAFNAYNELISDNAEYSFYVIDPDKTFEENLLARNRYYTKEVLDSYDKETRNIIETCILDDGKFKTLYEIKTDDKIRFIELSQQKYEIFQKM